MPQTLRRVLRVVGLLVVLGAFYLATAAQEGGNVSAGTKAGYQSVIEFLLLTLGTVLLVAAILLGDRGGARRRIVHLGMSLRRGERYAPELDTLRVNGDFTTPEGQAQALRQIVAMVDRSDIGEAFLTAGRPTGDDRQAVKAAQSLWQERRQRAGITHPPDAALPPLPPGVPRIQEGDFCFLGLVVVAADLRVKTGGTPEALDTWDKLSGSPVAVNAFFFYHLPEPAERLDETQARALLEQLRTGTAAVR